MTSRFASLALAAALCLHAFEAAAADEGPGLIGRSDCRVVNPNPQPNERVEWSGACRGGLAQGDGVLQWYIDDVLSSRYRGSLANGRPDGRGDYEYLRANTRYEGELSEGGFERGLREGRGRFVDAAGTVYEGVFTAGLLNGEGHSHHRNGADYVGAFLNDKPHGRGVLVYSDGVRYEGEFKFGQREGKGTLVTPQGRSLQGDWMANEFIGQGVEVLPGGERREGAFKAGVLSGQATVRMPDGRSFTGEFAQGLRNGPGVETGADGVRTEGRWVNGVLAPGFVRTTKSGERIPQRPAILNASSCAPRADDYPVASRVHNEQGTTRIRFMIGADGQMSQAEILRSSGHPRLDEVALRKLSACAFAPAADAEGHPVAGTFEVEYLWRLNQVRQILAWRGGWSGRGLGSRLEQSC